jgi:pimeloyl-ACP methyl ester carboxylesterase
VESPLGSFLCPPGYAGPSGLRAIAREGSAMTEAARFVRRSAHDRLHRRDTPYALRVPEPGLEPVVLVPGFMAGDGSLALMSRHLRGLGYRTYRSTMHANVGCTREASEVLEQRIEAIATKRGRKVTIVGHSLGGLMARGVAGRRPDLVDGILTLGSPILAPGAAHPILLFDLKVLTRLQRAGLGRMMGEDCTSGACAQVSWEQSRVPLARGVPFTSVFSRRDGIVDWRSCLDPQARTVEVLTSHLGMAFDPVVLDIVVESLAGHRARRARAALSQPATWSAAPDASVG